jgi:LPS-assembly protein
MKNNFYNIFITTFVIFFYANLLYGSELNVLSSEIKIEKNSKVIVLKGNVTATDDKNNKLYTDSGTYEKKKNIFKSFGSTKILTSEKYEVVGNDMLFDNKKKIISSNNKTKIIDKDGNQIFLDMFSYATEKNMFFSKGTIKVIDINKNIYNFSEIYIDEKKQKMIGTDVKAFLNQQDFKENEKNEPRFFANTSFLEKDVNTFNKGVFTYCKNRGKDKCPPWQIQSEKIEHVASKKTIYYKNAILKIYDFPIFYLPVFSHPDPTVKRKSGLLIPSLNSNSTLGTGISVPYFWAMSKDKDLTFTPKVYMKENPLLLAEYRHDFKNSFLIMDSGFTKGYKKTTTKKLPGTKSHFFSRYNMNLSKEDDVADIEVNIQHVSNDTYLKIHDVNSILANEDLDILENSFVYNYQKEDLFFGANLSAFDNMTILDNSKYEYLVPFLNLEKNITSSEAYGTLDLSSKFRVRNYDVNKQNEILVNDFDWKSNKFINKFGLETQFQGLLKGVNYNAKNTPEYKTDETNHEVSGAIGYLAKLGLFKNDLNNSTSQLLTPKVLLRYAPGHMRNIDDGRLKYSNLFNLNKVNEIDVIESGLSTSIGFDYTINEIGVKNNTKEKFSLSAGQVISEKENMDIPSSTSLDQKFSDFVGESKLSLNNVNLKYNFAVDQNYRDLNYNEVSADLILNKTKFNIGYLEEKNHIGSSEYVKSSLELGVGNDTKLSFSTKRNLLTSSAEFYNLSYEYFNDCLKAGLVFRREFYTDRDIEPDNSLMFQISIVPFGGLSKLSLDQ